MGDALPWIVIGIGILVIAVLTALLFRSFRRWRQRPPGSDPKSQAAEARLWSTRGMDQR